MDCDGQFGTENGLRNALPNIILQAGDINLRLIRAIGLRSLLPSGRRTEAAYVVVACRRHKTPAQFPSRWRSIILNAEFSAGEYTIWADFAYWASQRFRVPSLVPYKYPGVCRGPNAARVATRKGGGHRWVRDPK